MVGTDAASASLWTEHGALTFAPSSSPSRSRLETGHGGVHVSLPRDVPAYAVTTRTGDGRTDVTVPTDPTAAHAIEVVTGHGAITIEHYPRVR